MSKGNKQLKIRDMRNGNWYWIHRVVLEKYAKRIGSIGLSLYNVYASYARNKGNAFPTQKRICEILDISRSTLIKYNKILQKENLIKIESGKTKGNSNTVYLLKVRGCLRNEQGCSRDTHRGVREMNTKDKNSIKIRNKYNDTYSITAKQPLSIYKKYISYSKKQDRFYGDKKVDQVIVWLMDYLGLTILDGTKKTNRRYANLTIKKAKGNMQAIEAIIRYARQDKWYSTHITSTKDLYYSLVKLAKQAKEYKPDLVRL